MVVATLTDSTDISFVRKHDSTSAIKKKNSVRLVKIQLLMRMGSFCMSKCSRQRFCPKIVVVQSQQNGIRWTNDDNTMKECHVGVVTL